MTRKTRITDAVFTGLIDRPCDPNITLHRPLMIKEERVDYLECQITALTYRAGIAINA